jgi:fermentation-respiration switch protein FrsA (DUF1100 family)
MGPGLNIRDKNVDLQHETNDSSYGYPAPGPAAAYEGPVLLLHGTKDSIVPMWCSEKYLQIYGDKATLQVVEGENHTITRHRKVVIAHTVEFFKKVFNL